MRAVVLLLNKTPSAPPKLEFNGSTVMVIRPMQSENALFPMLVTLLGIVTLFRPVQLENALFPMVVTLPGIVTLVRPVQL